MADLRIPLFPLNVVLYPGMELPLKVFEERYHLMLTECLAPEAVALVHEVVPEERVAPRPALGYFGVCLTEDPEVGTSAEPALIGTLARIVEVAPPQETVPLLAVGVCRFRVDRIHKGRPFLEADITFLDEDVATQETPAYAEAARKGFEAYVEAMVATAAPEFGKALLAMSPSVFSAAPTEAGYRIGEALLVPLRDKQALLEADRLDHRLRLACALLAREVRRSRLILLARNANLN